MKNRNYDQDNLIHPMKTIFASALIATILLSACTQKPSAPQEPPVDGVKTAESNQQIKIVNSQSEKCENSSDQGGKDFCLLDLAKEDFYNYEDTKYQPEELCGKISENTSERAQCFWAYAMRNQKEALCDFLPVDIKEIEESINKYTYPETVNYTTKDACKQSVHYTYQDADWSLAYGIPPYADPFTLTYKGNAQISGWMDYETIYEEKMLVFHVQEDSIKKLPLVAQKRSDFFLQYKDQNGKFQTIKEEGQIAELFKFNEAKPATIVISKITMLMEGSPIITLERIVK